MVPFRRTVAILLPNLELDGEILLRSDPGVFEVSIGSLLRRRPTFVVTGSLDGICQYFGVDRNHTIAVRVKSDDLVVLFGNKRGKSVAAHAAVTPDRTAFIRQLCVGTRIGAEALPQYAPKVIETTANRVMVEHVQGQPLMPRGGSEEDLQTAILVALEPLKLLHARRNPLQTPDKEYLRSLRAFVEADKHRDELRPAFQVLDSWSRDELGSVTVHGDYWLDNVLGVQNCDRDSRLGPGAAERMSRLRCTAPWIYELCDVGRQVRIRVPRLAMDKRVAVSLAGPVYEHCS